MVGARLSSHRGRTAEEIMIEMYSAVRVARLDSAVSDSNAGYYAADFTWGHKISAVRDLHSDDDHKWMRDQLEDEFDVGKAEKE
jgi:tryptophanase